MKIYSGDADTLSRHQRYEHGNQHQHTIRLLLPTIKCHNHCYSAKLHSLVYEQDHATKIVFTLMSIVRHQTSGVYASGNGLSCRLDDLDTFNITEPKCTVINQLDDLCPVRETEFKRACQILILACRQKRPPRIREK